MTVNDPIQGILVRRPDKLFFVDRAKPLPHRSTPKTDRLQGIVFDRGLASRSVSARKLTDASMLANITPERIREVDSLTVAELEELTAEMVLSTKKAEAKIVHVGRHKIIHSIRMPLLGRNN